MHYDEIDSVDRRVIKGGSFLNTRDGENRRDRMRIRISTRAGISKTHTALNLGFRCAQTIRPEDKIKYGEHGFRLIQLRAPMNFAAKKDDIETRETKKKYERVEL